MVICLEQGANDLHMVHMVHCHPIISCFNKIHNGLSFWYQPTQVVLEKRRLNICVCLPGDVMLGVKLKMNRYKQQNTSSSYNITAIASRFPISCSIY